LLNKTTSQLVGPCSSPDANLFMLISLHWTNSIGRSEQQRIEIFQSERIGAPDANVSYSPIPARSFQLRSGFIKPDLICEESLEPKDLSEKFKNQ
jgi:hypothetical protein